MTTENISLSSAADSVFSIPRAALPAVASADEAKLKVLLFCCAQPHFSLSAMAEQLKITTEELRSALSYWQGAGVLTLAEGEKPRLSGQQSLIQSYDSATLHDALETQKDFRSVKEDVERQLGKLLNKNDISLLYNLYDFSGLSPEYILAVTAFSVSRGKTNMRYILQTALNLADEGIDTYDAFEDYVAARKRSEEASSRLRAMLGFGGRALTKNEQNFFTRWLDELELPMDLIQCAYEKMIDAIGQVRLPYMGKMLEEWSSKGWKTPAEVEKGEVRPKKGKKASATPDFQSFNSDAFFADALKKGFDD